MTEQATENRNTDLNNQGSLNLAGEKINLDPAEENHDDDMMNYVKEVLPGMIANLIPLGDAITDIPQQIELLSRVTLARSFIGADGSFRVKAFEAAWAIIARSNED
jgi:hypothetical protein